jgi:hypothetical protein
VAERVAVISCNLGAFDDPQAHVPQEGVAVDYYAFTDEQFPARPKAMTRRLQSKIPKMFGWDLKPGYDVYFWLDASLQFSSPTSVTWFLEKLKGHEMVVFGHPSRHSVHEEAEFLRTKIAHLNHYLINRYSGEDIDGQLAAIAGPPDVHLFASGAFCYRPTPNVIDGLKEWWIHTTRFHIIDQLAMPYALRHCDLVVLKEDIYRASHLKFTRRPGHG